MKNVLVTGGLGFIGSNFIRMLLKCGEIDLVINYDKQTYAGNPENLQDLEEHNSYKFVRADICDQGKVFKALEEFQADAVVNFAAESHVDRSIEGPLEFLKTNIFGTYNLLQQSLNYYLNINDSIRENFKFHHISTDEVFGDLENNDDLFNE